MIKVVEKNVRNENGHIHYACDIYETKKGKTIVYQYKNINIGKIGKIIYNELKDNLMDHIDINDNYDGQNN